jgi:hypothetical protein
MKLLELKAQAHEIPEVHPEGVWEKGKLLLTA